MLVSCVLQGAEKKKKPEVNRTSDEHVLIKVSPPSPSIEPSPTEQILAPLPSPENSYQRYQRQMSESHPNARMNIKNRPPLPGAKRISSKYGGMIDEHVPRVPRSSSTREFRKMDQKFDLLDD